MTDNIYTEELYTAASQYGRTDREHDDDCATDRDLNEAAQRLEREVQRIVDAAEARGAQKELARVVALMHAMKARTSDPERWGTLVELVDALEHP